MRRRAAQRIQAKAIILKRSSPKRTNVLFEIMTFFTPVNGFNFSHFIYKTRAELLHLLTTQLQDSMKKFRACGELHMLQHITRFDGNPGTRMAWLYHGMDQEMYHRGQVTVYARLLGIEPALTKMIRGMTS